MHIDIDLWWNASPFLSLAILWLVLLLVLRNWRGPFRRGQ
jgi:hypothetical protein